MNRTRDGKYHFTEEEKARVLRRRQDSQVVRDIFDRWYKGICLFPYHLYRSMRSDIDRNTGSKKSDCIIIKYGLYASDNHAVLNMLKLNDTDLMNMLNMLKLRLSAGFDTGTFRIKVVRTVNEYKVIQPTNSYLQIIFVEDHDEFQQVKGDSISVIDLVIKEDCELPW